MNPDTGLLLENATDIESGVLEWGLLNYREFPWRDDPNPWLVLIAEIMLQRTRVATVESVWIKFRQNYESPRKLIDADPDAVADLFRPLGLLWRIQKVQELAEVLVDAKELPTVKDELISLPGVGDYISSALLSLHMDQRAVLIDANVVRWLCRMVGTSRTPETRRKKWLISLADSLTPLRGFRDYNYGVLDLTMSLCNSKPDCETCPVQRWCATGRRTSDTNLDR